MREGGVFESKEGLEGSKQLWKRTVCVGGRREGRERGRERGGRGGKREGEGEEEERGERGRERGEEGGRGEGLKAYINFHVE